MGQRFGDPDDFPVDIFQNLTFRPGSLTLFVTLIACLRIPRLGNHGGERLQHNHQGDLGRRSRQHIAVVLIQELAGASQDPPIFDLDAALAGRHPVEVGASMGGTCRHPEGDDHDGKRVIRQAVDLQIVVLVSVAESYRDYPGGRLRPDVGEGM